MTIFRMFDGRHIDLARIVAVSEINYEAFEVWFQLMDKPLRFERGQASHNEEEAAMRRAAESAKDCPEYRRSRQEAVAATRRLFREEIDKLVGAPFREAHAALMAAWATQAEEA